MKKNLMLCLILAVATVSRAGSELPKYDEIVTLLKAHLNNGASTNLDQASVKGLLQQMKSQVILVTNNPATSSAPTLAKSSLYDDSFACFQLARVEGDAAGKISSAYQQLLQTNKSKIKGIVLDLRFASGSDYAAAGAVADCFLNSDQPLLDWGAGSAHAKAKTNAISVPVAVLLNGETSGSAEALASVLRETHVSLLIGSESAGQASIFSEYSLSNGEKLRIATGQIKSVDGQPITVPLKPDIAVQNTLSDDQAWRSDEYKILHPSQWDQEKEAVTNSVPRKRYNEATLVREQRNLIETDDDLPSKKSKPEFDRPLVADPALARALDLLKGLAVIQHNRPG